MHYFAFFGQFQSVDLRFGLFSEILLNIQWILSEGTFLENHLLLVLFFQNQVAISKGRNRIFIYNKRRERDVTHPLWFGEEIFEIRFFKAFIMKRLFQNVWGIAGVKVLLVGPYEMRQVGCWQVGFLGFVFVLVGYSWVLFQLLSESLQNVVVIADKTRRAGIRVFFVIWEKVNIFAFE